MLAEKRHLYTGDCTPIDINSFKTDKTAAKGNLGKCLKWKPQAKCHQNLLPG